MFYNEVIAPFLRRVRIHPNETCLSLGQQKFTNAAFTQYISPIMNELDTITPTTILLLMEQDVQSYAAFFACLLSGKIVVPVAPQWTSNELSIVQAATGSDYLLSTQRMQYYFRMTVEDALCRIDNGLYEYSTEQVLVETCRFTHHSLVQDACTVADLLSIKPAHPIHYYQYFLQLIS